MTTTNQRSHAIVVGASIAGLMTARVLSRHYQKVTVVERDQVNREPESRHGQPQTQHLHGLLPGGFQAMINYFPDLKQALVQAGANVCDFGQNMVWYTHGGYKKTFEMNLPVVTMSRPLLEHFVRERVLSLPNVMLVDSCPVQGLDTSSDGQRVTGITVGGQLKADTTTLYADLVVDATGRGSRSPQWLQKMGYKAPPITEVKAKVGYATRTYKRDPEDPRSCNWFLYTPEAPVEKCFGAIMPVEGNRWMVSVGGWHNQSGLMNETEFTEFVRKLPMPDIYDIISQSEPLTDVVPYRFSSSLRRHYEKMSRFPVGLLVLGDALTSFNPTYGQGMTSATLQAVELDKALTSGISDQKLAKRFFERAASVVDIPWQLAVGEDLRYPETIGQRTIVGRLIGWYISRIQRVTQRDAVVGKAFLNVMSLMKSPASLFHPHILWRVVTAKNQPATIKAFSPAITQNLRVID
jgi:2-polyprenyl-6-methoxyphenol hydroxylase-like FAD-dependent oxidoreductase